MMTKVRGGVGIRSRQIGRRVVLESTFRPSLDHAWRCLESDGGVTVQLGLVNELEPFIAGRPMSGFSAKGVEDPRGAPVLALPDGPYPFWICIRIVVDAKGKFVGANYSPNTLSVIVSPTKTSDDARVGLHAIAKVRLLNGVLDLYQIGRFDYQHSTSLSTAGRVRHHFEIV